MLYEVITRQAQQGVGQPVARGRVAGGQHVLEDGQVLEQPDVLEGARDAEPGDTVRLEVGDVPAAEGDGSSYNFV